jgi:Na+-driven multidrug efflux pump
VSRTPDTEDAPEVASELLDLREKPPEPLAPSPQALGVWELAWPTIAAMLTQTLVRWADVKMVGSLGREAVAAVTGGGHVYWFLQTVVMAVTTGLVALLARAVGARNQRLADATLRQGIVLGTVFGLATMVAGFPLRFVAIEIYGVEEAVVQYGATYLVWLLAGNVPFTLGFVFATGLRAAGDSRTPLVVGILANVLNVFLNWVLIYGNLGAPPLGVAGAGMASSLAMHLGDQQPERAARSGWRSLAGGIIALSLNGVLIIAFAEPIAGWFIDDAEVVALTVDFIWILGIAQPLMAVEFVMGGALRGAGDTRYPLGVVFVGLFVCRLIPATLAAITFHAPIQIVWSALFLDYATKATLLILRFAKGAWKEIEV